MDTEKKKNLTMQDLQDAVETINQFAIVYRKAQNAVKNLSKEQGKFGGMMGRGADPITTLLFGAVEGVVERKMEEVAEKKARAMTGTGAEEEEVDEGDLAEAKAGFDEEQEA